MYMDENLEIFVLRKVLKIFFKCKDKSSDTSEIRFLSNLITQVKTEIDEVFIKAKTRNSERKKK